MALTTDPQLRVWANTRVRPLADAITALVAKMEAYQTDYQAQGIAALITAAGASNTIGDGSDVDGRIPITGTQIVNFKAAVDQAVTALDGTLVSGVGSKISTIVAAIQVNGSIR